MDTIAREKALRIAGLANKKKAHDVVALDMRKISTFCDYFVICSGSSHRMVKALCNNIKEDLEKNGLAPHHIEGTKEKEPTWALIDYGDVVVHVFHEGTRPFYDLEWLWGDAKKLKARAG